jgi:Holliday junction resolvase RusA-like endonuclease
MIEVSFTIPGEAVPKARPRVFKRNGKATAITPAKTVNYENLVKWTAHQAMQKAGAVMFHGPLQASIYISLPIPSSWCRKRQEMAIAGQIAPTKKPDIDNLVKTLFDAMNGVVFRDDSQVVFAVVRKLYSSTPNTRIQISSTMQEAAK